jgi:hypothetical protein
MLLIYSILIKTIVFMEDFMKKKIILFTLIMGTVLFFSCQRTERTVPQAEEVFVENEPIVVPAIMKQAHSLLVNAGFYVLSGDDTGDETTKTRWSASLSLGESILTGETRRMTFENDGRVYNFIEARRQNGVEGFAFAAQVAVGGNLAVVIDENANLFRTPRTVDVSGVILSQKTIVIYYPETETDGYVEVRGYDRERQVYVNPDNSFVRLTALSRRNSDIQSAILLHTAMSLRETETVRRAALLDSALLDYPDSVFYMEIYNIANPNMSFIIEAE